MGSSGIRVGKAEEGGKDKEEEVMEVEAVEASMGRGWRHTDNNLAVFWLQAHHDRVVGDECGIECIETLCDHWMDCSAPMRLSRDMDKSAIWCRAVSTAAYRYAPCQLGNR
jgi:hypothetical protein